MESRHLDYYRVLMRGAEVQAARTGLQVLLLVKLSKNDDSARAG
jgi:hypothetical protein